MTYDELQSELKNFVSVSLMRKQISNQVIQVSNQKEANDNQVGFNLRLLKSVQTIKDDLEYQLENVNALHNRLNDLAFERAEEPTLKEPKDSYSKNRKQKQKSAKFLDESCGLKLKQPGSGADSGAGGSGCGPGLVSDLHGVAHATPGRSPTNSVGGQKGCGLGGGKRAGGLGNADSNLSQAVAKRTLLEIDECLHANYVFSHESQDAVDAHRGGFTRTSQRAGASDGVDSPHFNFDDASRIG